MQATLEQKMAKRNSAYKYSQSEKGRAVINRYQKGYQKRRRATVEGHLRHIFSHIKQRCNNPNNKAYKYYGGRGIKVCFKSVDEFVYYVVNVLQQDSRGLTIDRIDSDGHYESGNIWFCTMAQNVEYRGKDHFGGLI